MCIDKVDQAIRVEQEKKLGIANQVLTTKYLDTKHTHGKQTLNRRSQDAVWIVGGQKIVRLVGSVFLVPWFRSLCPSVVRVAVR